MAVPVDQTVPSQTNVEDFRVLRLRGGMKPRGSSSLTDSDYIPPSHAGTTQKKSSSTITAASYKRSILAEIIPIAIHRATDPAVVKKCWALAGIYPLNPPLVLQQVEDGPPYTPTITGLNIAGKVLTDDKLLDDIIRSEEKRKKKTIGHDQIQPDTIVESTSPSSQQHPSPSSTNILSFHLTMLHFRD